MDLTVREQRRLLAGATARRDTAALQDDAVRRAAVQWPQQGGQLLLALSPDERVAAGDLMSAVVTVLQERGWPGDEVLVEQLQGRLAGLDHVDLDQLASALDGAEGGLLDLQSGMTLPLDVLEDAGLEVDAPHTVDVPGIAAGDAWCDRLAFVDTLPEGPVRDRLARALDGRGAFRRFSAELDKHPELIASFLAWRDERALGRARKSLHEQGLLDLP